MYMDDIKQFAKNENNQKLYYPAAKIYSQDIKMKFDKEKCPTLIMKSRNDGRNRNTRSRKNQNIR